jgi:heme oxygenase (mycobilin-producing)
LSQLSSKNFIALSQFTVRNEMEDAVCEAFLNRPHLVENAPGFIRMEVMRPQQSPAEFWLVTWWLDELSYKAWHHSHEYHDSHQQMPQGLKLVPRSAKVTFLELVST